mmetsp:Transcript_19204/g.28584  ORF Transcript_19204/g.28584 Transcript_19204/m.28584 type:complete len:206 (-) Transcript_19204:61-678(-)
MSRRKGLSFDEKVRRASEFFYETKGVYNMKQLEKYLSKEKGIVSRTVKDVVQALVDDNLICMDKIGSLNCYWQFPSQSLVVRQQKIAEAEATLAKREEEKEKLEGENKELLEDRQDTNERRELLAERAQLLDEKDAKQQELNKFAACDPELMQVMRDDVKRSQEAANRWTDNIFMLRDYCKEKFQIEQEKFDKNFGVEASFDYLE